MLAKYTAFRFIKILESGRTIPLLLECEAVDDVGELRKFVVKVRGLPEVGEYELFVETLGYLLAKELGVQTPLPALIEISQEFIDIVNPILKESGLSIEAGLGFGSELISPVVAASSYKTLNSEQTERAVGIFCFDLLIQNPDRLVTNPNCLFSNGNFVAFDFNMAFSFLLLIGKTNEPWEVSKHQIHTTHLFFPALSGKSINFKSFINKVRGLNGERIEEILTAIPFGDSRWDDKIRSYMISIEENVEKLELEFARCLK